MVYPTVSVVGKRIGRFESMALRFVLGSSGSGKTEWLYNRFLELAKTDKRKMFYMIVPEQFTMQAQKSLVQMQENHAIMNIDVVSFERLAYRIFDELGKTDLIVLEDTGKNLILRKLAEDCREQLTTLRHQIHRMGYIDQIKSLISEFMQYGFSAEQLEDYISHMPQNSALYYKLSDMKLLYEAFEAYLSDGFVTAEKLLEVLADCTSDSKLLKDAVFAFDGFTGFTPVQMNLVRQLLKVSSDTYVTVTIDSEEELYADKGIQELFYMSRKMIRSVSKLAQEIECEIAEPVLISGQEGRFRGNPVLGFLEQHLFRPGFYRYASIKTEDGLPAGSKETSEGLQALRIEDVISVSSLATPKEELIFAAGKIRELISVHGYRFGEIAIVSGNVKGYEKYAGEVFDMYEIPFFSDAKETVYFHPFTEWVRALLEIVEKNYTYESVFRYLRTGLCGFSENEIDILDNYVLERGIIGYKKWNRKWVHPFKQPGKGIGKSEDEQLAMLQTLNELRSRLMEQTKLLYHMVKEKTAFVHDMTVALYETMLSLKIQNQLKEKQERYEAEGNEVLASSYAQIYRIVIDLLDKIVDLLGAERMPLREYADILDAGFLAAKVGIIPPGTDCVILGDIERTRLDGVKVLFFLGVNDGIIPKMADRQNLLSQYDRELLARDSIELAPTAREQVFLQKFYLYLNMTKPSEALYLTYARMDSLGSAQKPSYLVGTICQMFPSVEVREIAADSASQVITKKSSVKAYLKGLRQAQKGRLEPEWRALHQWRMHSQELREPTEQLFEASFACFDGEQLNTQLARQLYGTVLYQSVTRLETFARCAYAHFLEYGLKLSKRQEYVFEAADLGTLFHDSLECYSKKMKEKDLSWFDITQEQQEKLLAEALEETILGMDTAVLADTARSRYMIRRISNILHCSVWALTKQIRKGEFLPKDYEVYFRKEMDLGEGTVYTEGKKECMDGDTGVGTDLVPVDGRMVISGRIDRLDIYENDQQLYVKIMDYKSGKRKFSLQNLYDGLSLQLIMYLLGASDHLKRQFPHKDIVPAGVLYYHLDQPVVDALPDMNEEQIRQAVFEKLRPEGLVNQDSAVIDKLDGEINGKSDVIPVTLNKDGSLSKRGCSVATREQFGWLEDYVIRKMKENGREILRGQIDPYPVFSKQEDGCTWCPYKGICGFDMRIPGYERHELELLPEEEIWEKIREEEGWK